MRHKGKLLVSLGSALIVLYGVSAAFYGKVVAKDEAYKELSVFMDVLKRVNDDYVEAPDMNKVQEGAMRGLVEALDPYSSFLSKDQLEALERRKAGGTAGVGVVISKRAGIIYVVSCERGGPADNAGARAGDYIVAVDGESVEEKSIFEVTGLLRGAPDSKIKLSFFRSSRTNPLDLELTRKPDQPVRIVSQMLDGNIGLLDIPSLTGSAIQDVRVKLKTLISAGAQKLILDLRDCADGSSADGAELANYFLREGLIYYSQDRAGIKVAEVQAKPDHFVTDLPMVVLINTSTSGAGEITAGALKDAKRATVVGERSFGFGSAQKQIQLKSGSIMILSTAKFYTPSGKVIQDESLLKTGIEPDVQAPDYEKRQEFAVESYYDEKDEAGKYRLYQDKIDQIQLNKALEILSKGAIPAQKAA